MSSLNEKLTDPKWIEELKARDPNVFRSESYMLAGNSIRVDLKCSLGSRCKYGEFAGKGEHVEQKDDKGSVKYSGSWSLGWLFCYCCNKITHSGCRGFRTKDLIGLTFPLPFRCPECETDPHNELAIQFKQTELAVASIRKRKQFFVKPAEENMTTHDIDDSSASALEDSFRQRYDQQRKEFEKLSDKYNELWNEKSRERAEHQSAMEQIMEKLKKFDEMQREIQILRSQVEGNKGKNLESENRGNMYGESSRISERDSFLEDCIIVDPDPILTVDAVLSRTYLSGRKESRRPSQVQFRVESNAPLRTQRKSFIDDIETDDLTRAERITLEQAQAQFATSEAQREISETMNLGIIRKALPKISPFDGDPKKWIKFKRDIERYREVGKYKDDVMKLHLVQALQGLALARVQDIIDTASFDITMRMLEESFGEPTKIIDRCNADILSIRLGKELFRDDVVVINSKIQAYFAACRYANVEYANSNQLARHVFDQLSLPHKQLFRHKFRLENPTVPSRLIDLESLFSFLEELHKDLEDKRPEEKKTKSVQLNSVSSSKFVSAKETDNGGLNGYEMKSVNALTKACEYCSKNGHFLVQCIKFKSLSDSDKWKYVNEKRICRNCLLTTGHFAGDCNFKGECGYKFGSDRCGRKHHLMLHNICRSFESTSLNRGRSSSHSYERNRKAPKRFNAGANQRKAERIVREAQNEMNAGPSTQSEVPQVNSAQRAMQQAPPLSQVPRNQLGMPTPGPSRQVAITQTAIGQSNAVASGNNDIRVSPFIGQVFAMTGGSVGRTVKVFQTKIIGEQGYVEGYAVGDSAAEVTLMREDVRQSLGIEGEKCTMQIIWTDNTIKIVEAMRVDLTVQGVFKDSVRIVLRNCYAISELALPPRSLNVEDMKRQFPHLRKVPFKSYENVSPYLLIGSPHASAFESIGRLYEDGEGKPVGLKAKLGWTIYGGCPDKYNGLPFSVESIQSKDHVVIPSHERISNEMLYDMMAYFSSIESLGIKEKTDQLTDKEQKAVMMVKEEMRVLPNGSIELPLVWNHENGVIPKLPNNFKMVYRRQLAQEAKLRKNPVHMQAFNDNFKELLEKGYARAATMEDMADHWVNLNYIPMSLVINANKDPPKYRNVFDASARYLETSLNENLLKGPDLLVDLLSPLLSMRANKIAFSADIESMYMRIKINLRDQQCQRTLWRENSEEEFKMYIMSSMMFGPTPSPFCAQWVKNETAEKWKQKYPKAANAIVQDMYMDDLLTSELSVESAIALANQCIEIFKSVNWNLVSFQSNSIDLLRALPDANVKRGMIPLLESENDPCVTKVLGCEWDTKHDCFVFKFDKNLFVKIVREYQHRPTKRDQTSTLARIFDVLGLISHFIIRGRILVQRSWISKLDWDDEISEEANADWVKWLNEIENIARLKIPRQYSPVANLSECEKIELHTFCDAGNEAFACVSYFVTTVRGERYSNIVMAKAKVTPLNHKTRTNISEMPRLELCGCLIAARMADTIVKRFEKLKIQRYFWCDSAVVLRWISNKEHKLLKYAISPIEEILNKTERSEWRYVPSKLNAADIATKFNKFDFGDSKSVWFVGPAFLRLNESHWPEKPALVEPPLVPEQATVLGIFKSPFMSSYRLPGVECKVMADSYIDTFSPSIKSSWPKLVRGTARGLKIWLDGIIPLLESRRWKHDGVWERMKIYNNGFRLLTPKDMERAELFLIRKAQKESYSNEYECLRKNLPFSNNELAQLNVFMDSEGLIRINSRINLSDEIYPQKFAVVVPRNHAFTRLLLLNVHYQYKHICVESQMADIRSKYWVPQLRSALKSIQFHCNFCALKRAKPYAPMMAPLPDYRTNPQQVPFEVTGVDCLGPIITLNYTKTKKVWVMIFVCTLTRFIHLHILDSLESVKVLEAITVFWASHGPTRMFVSDRGTNFVGAANILEEDRKNTIKFLSDQHALISQALVEKYRVEWKLLPAHSPWMGGFYERMIKEVKRSIAHALESHKLTRATLNIALHDAAHRINNRPLTHNSVAMEDEPILTPHMLAKGRSGWPYLPGLRSPGPVDIAQDRSIYRKGRAVADEIMRRFYRNYLPLLTKRTKWHKDEKPLTVDDLVLLIEPNETRQDWKRGRVVRLYKGRDGRSRVADVIMPDGSLKKARSVQRLAKIEIKPIENAQ